MIIDLGLGQTAHEGLCLIARVLEFDGWAMTTGATMALSSDMASDLMTQALRNLVGDDVKALAVAGTGEKALPVCRARRIGWALESIAAPVSYLR